MQIRKSLYKNSENDFQNLKITVKNPSFSPKARNLAFTIPYSPHTRIIRKTISLNPYLYYQKI